MIVPFKVTQIGGIQEYQFDKIASQYMSKEMKEALTSMKDHPNIIKYHQFFEPSHAEEEGETFFV